MPVAGPRNGSTRSTSPGDSPTAAAAAAPRASSSASRAPFHATSTPSIRNSGAAYSTTTGSAATARATTAS